MKKTLSVLFTLGLVIQMGLFPAGQVQAGITAFAAPKVTVASVKLTPSAINLAAGNTGTIKATVAPSNAANKTLSWKSSNTAVVSVDSKGKVTALSIGTATKTCTAKDGSGKKALCKATVIKPTTKAQILRGLRFFVSRGRSRSTWLGLPPPRIWLRPDAPE